MFFHCGLVKHDHFLNKAASTTDSVNELSHKLIFQRWLNFGQKIPLEDAGST